jgi:NAD(P)-dependent dehydrogenase (short-subunit alcohol dehydrogenase family)
MPTYCVIGSNRGIGLEFVRQLAASKDNTIIATVRPDADRTDLEAVASPSTHILECDTASVQSVHIFSNKVARNVLAGSSGPSHTKIDFLIVNAGINGTPTDQNSLSLDPVLLAEQIAVNVVGPAKVVEFLVDRKALAPGVRILNMSSGLGSLALSANIVPRKSISYSLSKAALNMLTVHQGHDVRARGGLPQAVVIAMDPGWVKTRMGGEGAPLEASESVSGMLQVLHGLKDEDNVSFFDARDGERKPW